MKQDADNGERRSKAKPKMASKAKTRDQSSGRVSASFEKLLQAAGEVLADTGFEKLTSNEICARAGLTPPTFYHYFNNKYEVLEELADRLLRKQNEIFETWLAEYAASGEQLPPADALEKLFRSVTQIVSQESGGMWTIRALRALPNLGHLRLKWQRLYADQIHRVVRELAPEIHPDILWSRVRIIVEFSYIVDELAIEEDRIPQDVLFREVSLLLGGLLEKLFEK